MRKIKIHTEPIKKQQEKIQFQIKLPATVIQVTGILVTLNPMLVEGVELPAEGRPVEHAGSIWLRIPQKRDVFYAENLKQSNHLETEFHGIVQEGLVQNSAWWFSGEKREFFSITVPIEDTLIEAYYMDESLQATINYHLNIYLELEMND